MTMIELGLGNRSPVERIDKVVKLRKIGKIGY